MIVSILLIILVPRRRNLYTSLKRTSGTKPRECMLNFRSWMKLWLRTGPAWIGLLLGTPSGLLANEPSSAASASASKPDARQESQEDYELFHILVDTLDQVERNYVKNISRRELLEAAIEGVLDKLDPYSSYINREEMGRFKTNVESQFGGIGIQIGVQAGQLKVISPLTGTPAYRAGILAGDVILEIDGKPAANLSLEDAVKRLKGDAGTSISLSILHPGTTEKKVMSLTREMIHVETILGDYRKPDDTWDFYLNRDKRIGYVRLTAFSNDTPRDLKRVIEQLRAEGLKGLILDLRFNPGGLLTSAVEVSDMFISSGRIVSTQGRNTAERTWDAKKEGTFEGFPMVVLVNGYSASASEIVSACLQDHKRAIIVGERTWGKGSVQNVIELEDGKSALKLTTASYRRPNGHNIHRFPDSKDTDEWGVMPNDGYEVKLSLDEITELLRIRRERDILQPKSAVESTSSSENKPSQSAVAQPDRQLQKALDYLSQALAQAK